ncbi:MAG: hypothetical protein ABSF61_05275 [Anaerolineales bacterium]
MQGPQPHDLGRPFAAPGRERYPELCLPGSGLQIHQPNPQFHMSNGKAVESRLAAVVVI